MPLTTQLLIIGAGPGGYTAAFHAADLGLHVTLIDKEPTPGGVCLYRGCIPSKALLHAADIITGSAEAKSIGLAFSAPNIDLNTLRTWKEGIVTKLTAGLSQLTKARKITYLQGQAKLLSACHAELTSPDGSIEEISFDKAILATGSSPIDLALLPKSSRVWDSTSALTLPRIPATLLIIGGGYIGLELGSAYSALGAKITVVEALPQLLSGADPDLADILIRRLKKTFLKIMTDTKVLSAQETANGITLTFQDNKGHEFTDTYEQVLTSIGRRPNTDNLGLETTKIKMNAKGFLEVNAYQQTAEANIYAIGDIAGQPMLAHKASSEARTAVENIVGNSSSGANKTIPAVVYTNPELAWVGLAETEAKAQGLNITVFKFPWNASGRAMTKGRTEGITKIIADKTSRRILGVSIVGQGAGDLIAEGALAITMQATADDLANTIHPHPTMSETLMETAEGLFGHCTHLLSARKD